MPKKVLLLIVLSLLLLSSCKRDTVAPKVISTNPQNGLTNVNPLMTKISVTFSEPMMDKSWSWCYEGGKNFPETTGDSYYTENNTKNILPVKLEPNTEYLIWINLPDFDNFRDKSGNPVEPYKFTFKTGELPKPE